MAATWGQNQITPAMIFPCQKKNVQNQVVGPQDFTGLLPSNFSLSIHPLGGTAFTGGGAFQIISAAQGIVAYQPVLLDFATLGPTQLTVAINSPGYDPSLPLLITVVPV